MVGINTELYYLLPKVSIHVKQSQSVKHTIPQQSVRIPMSILLVLLKNDTKKRLNCCKTSDNRDNATTIKTACMASHFFECK
jgi:hypothetical protein